MFSRKGDLVFKKLWFLGKDAFAKLGRRGRKARKAASRSLLARSLRTEPLEERRLLSVSPAAAFSQSDSGLIAQAIPPVDISQGTTQVVSVSSAFEVVGESSPRLRYEVVADSNPSLFAAPPLADPQGQLLLPVAADASGNASLTVRASDNSGLSANAVVVVNVPASDAISPWPAAGTTSTVAGPTPAASLATSARASAHPPRAWPPHRAILL